MSLYFSVLDGVLPKLEKNLRPTKMFTLCFQMVGNFFLLQSLLTAPFLCQFFPLSSLPKPSINLSDLLFTENI